MENELKSLLAQHLNHDVDEIALDTDLVETLGFDSLAGLRWLALIEKKFAVRFPDDRLHEFRNLRSIANFIDVEVKS